MTGPAGQVRLGQAGSRGLARGRLAARGHENGPGLTSFAATFGSVGPSP